MITERDRNKRLLMHRFQALGIDALWTESPGDNLCFFQLDDDGFDTVRVTGYYAFVRIKPRTPAELRGICATFQTASGIEVSCATPKRLIRLPGQPGTPAIDPETREQIEIESSSDDDCPHRRRMAGAALIYEDLTPVDGATLEALLSCEGLLDDCLAATEEPDEDIDWDECMDDEDDPAPGPAKGPPKGWDTDEDIAALWEGFLADDDDPEPPEGQDMGIDIIALWDEFVAEEGFLAAAADPEPPEGRTSPADGEGRAAGRPESEPDASPAAPAPSSAPSLPPKRPPTLHVIDDDDPCTFTVSTRYASAATHAIGGDADRVDEGVELVLDNFIASRPAGSRTCSNRDEAAGLLRRNVLFMCKTYDPSMVRKGVGPDVAEARRVQRRADERRIARSLRLRDSHVIKAARRMGAPDWFVKKLARFLPVFRRYAGRVAATALRRIFTQRELAWFRQLFVVVREFVQGFRCRQWDLDSSLIEQVEGTSSGTVVMDGGRKARGRNLYVNTAPPLRHP